MNLKTITGWYATSGGSAQCNKYDRERAELIKNVGIGGMEVEKLLGDPDFITHTLDFVEKTERFSF